MEHGVNVKDWQNCLCPMLMTLSTKTISLTFQRSCLALFLMLSLCVDVYKLRIEYTKDAELFAF